VGVNVWLVLAASMFQRKNAYRRRIIGLLVVNEARGSLYTLTNLGLDL